MPKSPLLIEMGKRIADLRNSMGMTQEQLAESANINQQTVSSAENGTKALRPENLLNISNALGVSTDFLLTGKSIDKDEVFLLEKIREMLK